MKRLIPWLLVAAGCLWAGDARAQETQAQTETRTRTEAQAQKETRTKQKSQEKAQTAAQQKLRQHAIHDADNDGLCDVCGNAVGSGRTNAQGKVAKKGKHWGPGDGTGNQGAGPADGTGYGAQSGKQGKVGAGPTAGNTGRGQAGAGREAGGGGRRGGRR
ncbi:MAG: hypothetical protein AB1898_03315 [Acidobacteriota bacterium]